MAKDFYDKLKVWSDILKNNWPQILLILSLFGSSITNIGQYFGAKETETELAKTQIQVSEVAKYYMAPPEPAIKQSCGSCDDRKLIQHLKEYRQNMREFHGVK